MSETLSAKACVVGGGPAGMMLALLLARAGLDTVLLEKHGDFLRDFRGDTIHPSTLDVLAELGLLEELLTLPHQKAQRIEARAFGLPLGIDFRGLPTRCRYVMFMPQWDFLSFLQARAARFPQFRLRLNARATGLVREGRRVVGARAETPQGELTVSADLVVACDGRHSALREAAGLAVEDLGAPMDVLWFRLPKRPGDPELPQGIFQNGGIFIMLNQGPHWQCGFVIAKGGFERLKAEGLPAFKGRIAALSPLAAGRLEALGDWEQVKLLSVKVDRLPRWHRDGLLFIGDAAHAMSPIGGVGINLAIQDAVAAANLLAAPLRAGRPAEAQLARVQRRREWPARATQWLQVAIQNRVISPLLEAGAAAPRRPPLTLRALARFPRLQRLPGRLVGVGVRPEHVAPL